MKQKIKQLQSLLLLLILTVVGTANAWGDDFSVSVKSSVTEEQNVDISTTDQNISTNVDISGGSMFVSNSDASNARCYIKCNIGPTGDKRKCFRIETDAVKFKITLNSALANGDVISADFFNSSSNIALWLSTSSTKPGSAPTASLSHTKAADWTTRTYTVQTGDGICGATTFYIYRSSNTTHFTNFSVTRSGGGSCSAPSITCSDTGELTMVSNTDGASIYYTLNGAIPTSSSTPYISASKPSITATTTVKAIAIKGGLTDSNVTTQSFTMYDVTYDDNGKTGGSVPSTEHYKSGATVTAASNSGSLAKTNYTFAGWNTANDGSGNNYTAGSGTFTISANTTLYAKWTQDVTLDKNTGSTDGSATATWNSTSLTIGTAPVKSSSTLMGYYAEAGGTTKIANADGTLIASKDGYTDGSGKWIRTGTTILFAKWAAASTSVEISYTESSTITSTTWSKNGYSLSGPSLQWKAGTTSFKFSGSKDYTISVPSGVTVTAIAITGYSQSGDGTTITIGGTSKAFTTSSSTQNYTITGHTAGSDITLTTSAKESTIASIVLTTGSGTTTYTVTYDGNGSTGGTAPTDASSPYDSGATVTVLDNTGSLVKTGYDFDGWNTAADGSGTPYAAAAKFTIASNTTLFAQWTEKEYTITLDKKAGSVNGSAKVTYNGTQLTNLVEPTYAGYVVEGYYTDSELTTKVADAEGNLLANVTSYTTSAKKWIYDDDKTLYTKWNAVYTVTFDATTNDGTCDTPSLTQASAGASIILPVASKDGASFSGWYDASSAGTRIGGAGEEYTPTGNITLYAQFATSSTKFSMVRVGTTDASTIKDAAEHELTVSEATITGGSAAVRRANGDVGQYLSTSYSGSFYMGNNNLYYKINLDQALAQGDVISYTGYNSMEMYITTTATQPSSGATSTSEYSYTIPAGSPLIGQTTIYLWRATGSSTWFNNLTITTTASALTYDVSFETNGIADEMEGLTEVTNLPNPLPTPENISDGYTFEGWYTDAAFTSRATAGAALADNTTLYANYIIDTPTISQNGGAIYAGTAMSLTSDVAFTRVYAKWKSDDGAFDKATATGNPGDYQVYPSKGSPSDGDPRGTYNFTSWNTAGTSYFAYMISDGTFYSVPAVTNAFTVKQIITITTQPKGATYVQDADATDLSIAATVTGSGTLSYKWKQSSDRSSWNDAEGTNDEATYSPSTSAVGTTYYKCIVSSNNGAGDVESDIVAVTVNAAAVFTVSFDKGIGSSTAVGDITQGSQGAPITLPSVTLKNDNYEFEGWYDSEDNKVGVASDSYTPQGHVTLTAKYNCKVTLATAGGSGTISAVKTSDGTPISSGDKVLEGTEITITATPTTVNEFVSWSGDASGTTNPVTIEVSDVTSVTANFTVSEYEELFHTTFITADGWAEGSENVLSGSTGEVVEKTINGTKVTFAGKSGTSYTLNVNTSTNKLKYGGSNLNASVGGTPNCYMAIHLTGVNGSITVDFGSTSQKWIYALDDGSTGTITTGKTTLGSAATSFTIDNLTSDEVTLYLGQKNVTISELIITTPKTKLTADPTELNFIGTASTADVKITTNSPGAVTATSNNTSVATVTYDGGTKKVTVTPKAKGSATIKVSVAQSGAYPAKEIEIPVTVADPEIIVSTQPSNLTFYQNDAAAKTFTVSASANTGADLSYQWYTCNADGTGESAISGAIESTYTLNTNQKKTVGTTYYKCEISTGDACPDKYTNVVSVTVSALDAGGTYNATVYVAAPGNTLTYTGLSAASITSGASTTEFSASLSTGTLTITASAVGTNSVVLNDGTTINVTVKKHVIKLTWTAEKKQYTVDELSAKSIVTNSIFPIDDGSHPENLPYLIRQYEDGTPYTGVIDFYSDDVTIAYFGTSGSNNDHWEKPAGSSDKPVIRYGGGQGGCVFYAYVPENNANGVEAVKATYDLRIINGYSNDLPSGRKVSVQQQYTLWNGSEKLITVTYGGYKYNNAKWSKGTDSWGTATNYVGKENVIDGYAYAVRNKQNDAADEYEHAIQVEDDFGSAWYASGEGGTSASYQRIKPFRLPCRASYLTFTAHKSGTLTAYVYQNGIIGRGGNENQLASGPRLGYWFDEEGWVQNPSATVVSKQKIANNNARDKRIYDGKTNDQQMTAYWGSADDTDNPDAIVITKLRKHYCSVEHPNKDTPASAFSDTKDATYKYDNPYYWGNYDEISANNGQVVPTPETPVPHQGGHLIVNEGYVKYTIDVKAGKTYYFFGKMTKVGYAGMNFVPAGVENRVTSPVDLAADDDWSTAFGKTSGTRLNGNATTIYNEITVPSNYRIGKWNTICLPFSVNENQVEQVFGKGTQLAIFNGLRHDVENHIYYIKYLRHVDQNILPGQPYLIYPTGKAVEERSNQDNGGMKETGEPVPTVGDIIGTGSAGNVKLTFHNVIINKGITAQSYGCDVDADGETVSYTFTGTDKPTDIVKYDIYNTPKTGELKRYMGAGTSLNTYHALMKATSDDIKKDAIQFAFSEDDVDKSWTPADDGGEPTGVIMIEDDGVSEQTANYGRIANGKAYNMMGQQVNARSAKGIILVNGNKVVY